ncbi:hypothetical protein EOM09_05575 [bacterium]|nr:hypothetical protein [bacterium]
MKNENIDIYETDEGLKIEIIPYNRELTIDYVVACIRRILRKYKNEDFIIRANGYNIDGLYESNNLLCNYGSRLYSNYYNTYRTI